MSLDEQAKTMEHEDIVALLASHQEQTARIDDLTRQLEWFKKQMFGEKSERRLPPPDGSQSSLGEWAQGDAQPEASTITIAEHRRRRGTQPREDIAEGGLRFAEDV